MDGERGQPDRVLVGIDGSWASRSAVRWAAREARIRGASLIITHIEPPTGLGGVDGPTSSEATATLNRCAAVASQHEPGVPVGTVLLHGSVTDGLIGLSRSSAVLVLGLDRERTQASHGLLGPVEDRVVAQAECPVVTLNRAPRNLKLHPFVVVGWTNNKTGHRTLAAAAAEAAIRHAALTIVSVAPQLEDVDPAEVQRRRQRALSKAQTLIQKYNPSMAVDLVQATGQVAQALTRHSLNADLLIVGCHHAGDPWGFRTGPVAAELMRAAECPVMLVGRLATRRRAVANSLAERPTPCSS